MSKIASIICYCTHDYRFIGKCIEEAKKFSSQILIPVCDCFFDGSPENRCLLERTYSEHPDCQFIEFAYDPKHLYSLSLSAQNSDPEWKRLWHATARYIGFLHLDSSIEHILFLDSDEIVEGLRFNQWLATKEHEKWNAIRLDCYYYVLRCHVRAKNWQTLPLLAKKSAFGSFPLIHPDERYGLFLSLPGPKVEGGKAPPFIHHYSWVRPLEENLHKASTWGHQKDLDWNSALHNDFKGGELQRFFGMDFEFEEVDSPYFDPLSIPIPSGKPSDLYFPHVKKVDRRAVLQMEFDSIYP